MASFPDIVAKQLNSLTAPPQTLTSSALTGMSAKVVAGRALPSGPTTADPNIDAIWAGYDPNASTNSYFDYYFSGQDISVHIDGLQGFAEFRTIPISDFSFNIIQQKMPVYGFWSYTYDAIARGSRIINGSFRLVTRAPDYMRRALEAAAQARQNNSGQGGYTYFRGLTDDDKNIERFWGNNLDPSLASVGKQIFSTHPPFSFVIVYGVQSVSVDTLNISKPGLNNAFQAYQNDNPIFQDTNERLVGAEPLNGADRIILDDCELVNMSSEYHSTGQLVVEDYQFVARDYVIPAKGSSNQPIVSAV